MSAMDSFGEIDKTLIQGLAASIEAAVNTALRYDPSSRQKMAAISDILAIDISTPQCTFYIRGQEAGIAVLSYCESPIATHLQGSPSALLNLLKQPTHLKNSGVNLVGSVHLLQQWQDILQNLEIDWEDAISRVLGDIVGPLSSTGIKHSAQWIKTQWHDQRRMFAEYLSEELKVIPSKPEVEHFFDKVDDLTLAVDRIAARIHALSEGLREKKSTEEKESTEQKEAKTP
jgi:ubiquinone biosynthesis accessory factor UbiJ